MDLEPFWFSCCLSTTETDAGFAEGDGATLDTTIGAVLLEGVSAFAVSVPLDPDENHEGEDCFALSVEISVGMMRMRLDLSGVPADAGVSFSCVGS